MITNTFDLINSTEEFPMFLTVYSVTKLFLLLYMSSTIYHVIFIQDCGSEFSKVTRCCQDSLGTVMTDTAAGSMWLFSFTVTDDCFLSDPLTLQTTQVIAQIISEERTSLNTGETVRVLSGNVVAIHFTAFWSGWVESEPEYNKMRTASSVLR